MKVVFCKDCKYCTYNPNGSRHECTHPKNIKSSYFEKIAGYLFLPRDINHDNDCEDFKQKPWWKYLVNQ